MIAPGRWRIGLSLVLLATVVRLVWALCVPTIPVGDFATYRESAMQLGELGHLDHGFIYMPGWVVLLAGLHLLGGEVLAAKLLGVAFGGFACGPLYVIAARLFDAPGAERTPSWRGAMTSAPVALVTGLSYALWPAGIALGSVVGTDIPAAATMLLGVALLVAWGPSRPWLASAAFGAVMGLAAYLRAVALPLTALSAVYWVVRRTGARATVARTAVAIALTVTVLLPWGLRNRRVNGEFFLTDSHGGITALMGNDPNTEGTYSRSLSVTFRELTGRTFLSEPHRETDRIAYRLARQWIVAEPLWTAGMIAMRAERLFAAERGLLYWSIYRPGVLPPAVAAWFNVHRPLIVGLTDWFYLAFVLALCAGFGFAWAERRWTVCVPAAFALAQVGTYVLFVAEPRYRLTTEVFLFPIAGLGAHRLVTGGRALVGRLAARGPGPRVDPAAARGWLGTGVAVVVLIVAGVATVYGGAALRDRHRWAATVWRVDGQPRLALWHPRRSGGGASAVRGTPPGATLTVAPGKQEAASVIVLPDVALPPGPVQLEVDVDWPMAASGAATVTVGPATAAAGVRRASGTFVHAGGPLRVEARLTAADGAAPLKAAVTAVRVHSGAAP